ncbi:MAG TPA: hypothetical protein VF172_09650 [Nitrososphaera sp.]|jgi:hypothetical protein
MANCCVMCLYEFDPSDVTFEQRLVEDDSFCRRCWTEIMKGEYDNDLEFSLMEVAQKRRES